MPDEHSTWIIREITDVVATATELGRRRTNGEIVADAERRLARMAPTATTTPAAPTASNRPGVTR